MEQKISIAKLRSAYCKQVEKDHRSLSNYLTEINKDFKSYTDKVPAATARMKESYSFFAASAMTEENLSLPYIKKWYSGIDSKGRICDFKKIELSEESAAKEKYSECDFIDKDTFSIVLIPVNLWTSSKLLAKVASAIKSERDAASAAAAAVREQERAAKHAANMERLAAKVDAWRAANAAKEEQQSKQESKSKSKQSGNKVAASA